MASKNIDGHAVVNQRVAQRHIAGDVPGRVLHGNRLQLEVNAAALQSIQELILRRSQAVAIGLHLIV